MSDAGTAEVFVVLGARGATNAADRAFLLAAATWALGVAPGVLALARRCPQCGGDDHGRPIVRRIHAGTTGVDVATTDRAGILTDVDFPLQVSLSRAGGTVAVALTIADWVGLDIESIATVAGAGFDDVAFNAVERAALANVRPQHAARRRATMWTAKEAALKAVGTGLRVDPSALTVLLADSVPAVSAALTVTWDSQRPPNDLLPTNFPGLVTFVAGQGLVGTVALCGTAVPVVRVVPARRIRQPARPPRAQAG